ncbi:hypothetical protein [Nonlabens xiamenensis]|uniref:hypothetical protein n=1 Tax=Nonlabens xiamenensis TaxID=2341043 RepID=UPI000F60C202|nr:hypothetical protein [Nonlabens xiamenensis]
MPIILLIVLAISAAIILLQDLKDRQVHLVVLLLFLLASGCLQYSKSLFFQIYILESAVNTALILLMLGGVALYFKFLKGMDPKQTLGKGDVVVFLAFALGYGIEEFVLQFVISLVAALSLHLILKRKYTTHTSVPLAGYMTIYLAGQKFIEQFNFFS